MHGRAGDLTFSKLDIPRSEGRFVIDQFLIRYPDSRYGLAGET
jgi:hypothetical protein